MRHILALALTFVVALVAGLAPSTAHAWWNKDWTQRTRITLNTSAQGLETKEAANAVSVAVRLHSGNFDFAAAKEDGSDLRVVGGDDKTPLRFSVERFDGINELAVLWVQAPIVAPGSDKNQIYVYAGNAKVPAEASDAAGFDANMLAVVHFSDKELVGSDPIGGLKTASPIAIEPNGLLAASAKLDGKPVVWLASEKVKVEAAGALTVSLWVRADNTSQGTLFAWGPLTLALKAGKLGAQIGPAQFAGGDLAPATWTHIALTVGAGKARLYVNGAQSGEGDAMLPALAGEMRLGEGIAGLADELELAKIARTAEWLRISAGAQGAESKLVASLKETSGSEAGESPGYFGILIKNLTADAWVVIGILGVMFVIAVWVMFTKAIFVIKADKENRQFLRRFRGPADQLLTLDSGADHPHSSLYRLYLGGLRELKKRNVGVADAAPLSGASLNAVKASVDADLVRESHSLNERMVLLTIAISGGPFLGLLGTVVGVMITFAAIAAAGDVNVNAIAPGIAAALLATVAGLSVAIPALFGYNYLAARIKNISSDMQIFVDEFITRVAEVYGAR